MSSEAKKPVVYNDGTTKVLLGDVITCRSWSWLFRKKPGRVVYVPGISKRNAGMEHGGASWVGTKHDDGTVIGTWVEPETQVLKKSVQFVRRGDGVVEELGADVELEG